jgi:chromosome segregation ATPase
MIMKKKSETLRIPSAKAGDQPATRRMLSLVRDELKSEIRTLERKMDSRFDRMESRFDGHDSRFKSIDSQFKSIDSQFKSVDSRFKNIDSQFKSIDSRFKNIDSRFINIDSQFKIVDSRFNDMEARLEEIKSEQIRCNILLEEQNSNNRIVLEGLQALWQRQARVEEKVDSKF